MKFLSFKMIIALSALSTVPAQASISSFIKNNKSALFTGSVATMLGSAIYCAQKRRISNMCTELRNVIENEKEIRDVRLERMGLTIGQYAELEHAVLSYHNTLQRERTARWSVVDHNPKGDPNFAPAHLHAEHEARKERLNDSRNKLIQILDTIQRPIRCTAAVGILSGWLALATWYFGR